MSPYHNILADELLKAETMRGTIFYAVLVLHRLERATNIAREFFNGFNYEYARYFCLPAEFNNASLVSDGISKV